MTWTVDGELADPTSVKLSDPDGNFGVKRTDTDETVVADATAMTKESTGVYTHTFDDPADGLTYNYYVEVVHAGATYHFERNQAAAGSTPESIALGIESALTQNPGVKSVQVDGQKIDYDRAGALKEHSYWERKAAIAAGTRPRAAGINLSGF